MLSLAEMYFLLTLNEHKSVSFSPGGKPSILPLARALLEELLIDGYLQITDNLCYPNRETTPTGNPALEAAFCQIMQSVEVKTLFAWASEFSEEDGALVKRIAGPLVAQGIVSVHHPWYDRFIPVQTYSLKNPGVLDPIVTRLRDACLTAQPPDKRTLALLRLLNMGGRLSRVFSPAEENIVRLAIIQYEKKRPVPLHG